MARTPYGESAADHHHARTEDHIDAGGFQVLVAGDLSANLSGRGRLAGRKDRRFNGASERAHDSAEVTAWAEQSRVLARIRIRINGDEHVLLAGQRSTANGAAYFSRSIL